MTRTERNLVVRNAVIGVTLSVLVAVAAHLNMLQALERWLSDKRAAWCQLYSPPVSDALVHLDIDDSTLDAVGKWPWPRATLAQIVDEVARADAKVLAFDVLFLDPQDPRFEYTGSDQPGPLVLDDELFAWSIEDHGRVVLPMSVQVSVVSPQDRKAVELLEKQLNLSQAAFIAQLGEAGFTDVPVPVSNYHLLMQREAAFRRVGQLLEESPGISLEDVVRQMLPDINQSVTESNELSLVRTAYARQQAVRAMRRFSRPVPDDIGNAVPVVMNQPPIAKLGRSAAATGFVNVLPDDDGVVRTQPMWTRAGDRLYPQFALSVACAYLGVDPADVEIERTQMTIPRPGGGSIIVPLRQVDVEDLDRPADLAIDIPWFGGRDWETMYDPSGQQKRNHVPLNVVWQICVREQKIRSNNATIDLALRVLLEPEPTGILGLNPKMAQAYFAEPPEAMDTQARVDMIAQVRTMLERDGWMDEFDFEPADEQEAFVKREFDAALSVLKTASESNEQLAKRVVEEREKLHRQLEGRAVVIGWTSTGAIADFVNTSIHQRCPGVVVHGVIFNGLVTNHVLTTAPAWMDFLITVLVGLLTTVAVVGLGPIRALTSALGVAVGYAAINGVLLYDYGDMRLTLAAPLVNTVMIWAVCTGVTVVVERTERARITRRFSSYVDPALVSYVLDHPDQVRLDGQVRELTVCFTDLAGFTTLSEKLQERTVPILNDYMGAMVPIIRNYHGYVNKFLGDGMMFFYGAPFESETHARDAVHTAIELQRELVTFNEQLTRQELPNVAMRVGISTGSMVVGDAGSADASDYTVLGDSVNLGARLESANKYTGTWIMLNDRNAELVRDDFLLCPIGRLQVVGKSQGVMTYEPLAVTGDATDDQKRLVDLRQAVLDAYIAAKFNECLEALAKLDEAIGETKLSKLYRDLVTGFIQNGVDEDFAGQIVLESK